MPKPYIKFLARGMLMYLVSVSVFTLARYIGNVKAGIDFIWFGTSNWIVHAGIIIVSSLLVYWHYITYYDPEIDD